MLCNLQHSSGFDSKHLSLISEYITCWQSSKCLQFYYAAFAANISLSGLRYAILLPNYLIVLPISASMVQVQWRLFSYGAGYPGDRIRPDTAPVMWPPHSAINTGDKGRVII